MIINFGSINIDHVYQVPHLVAPGETLAATSYAQHLGGKGANQSLAVARAGAEVLHVGAMNSKDQWALQILRDSKVDTSGIAQLDDEPSGHAIISVDEGGENSIVIVAGANGKLDGAQIDAALAKSKPGDWALLQYETNAVCEIATRCKRHGLQVAFNPAPFNAEATLTVLPQVDLLIVNETESEQLRQALGGLAPKVPQLLTTLGARGANLQTEAGTFDAAPFSLEARDTTAAGDTFIGYFMASRALGLNDQDALRRASAAAALSVTVSGAAESIPHYDQVDRFLAAF